MNEDLKKIVWLASYPKSGNTWFRVFLTNLFSDQEAPASINELHSTPIASSRSLFDDHAGVSSSDLSQEEIDELRPEVYRKLAGEATDPVFHKVHDAWGLTPSGKPVFPAEITRAVLYFIRNPLDVTVSFAFHGNKHPGEMVEEVNNPDNAFCNKPRRLYNQLLQPLSDWSGHVSSWVDGSGLPVHVLRYEDMLTDTFATFREALQFTGIDKSDAAIRAAIAASDLRALAEMEQREGFREKPIGMKAFFREGKSGSWREHLDASSVNKLVKKHRAMMERFGYLEQK
ncbi:MAG: sulfotransferase domain-containing protein [Bacteroidales bacterium]|nr:sulfotransferase domain-containing protein [Bacteroidales bacterium]